MISREDFLKIINNKNNKRLVFNVATDAGFYSEFNNMLFCLVYCLEKNIAFNIQSNGKSNFYEKGWNDYFLPVFKEVKLPLLDKYNVRPYMTNGRSFPIMTRLLKYIYNIGYFTQDFFDQPRMNYKEGGEIKIPELNSNYCFLELCSELIRLVYVFNTDTRKEIDKLLESISLPQEYYALHIRRGDKVTEVPLYAEEEYLKQAITNTKDIYIHSDSYEVVETIRKRYPGLNIYSLTDRNYTGYIHKDFVKLEPNERRKIMINLFANIEIFCKSEVFIGSIDSNPGMFVWMSRAGKNCFDVNGRSFIIY